MVGNDNYPQIDLLQFTIVSWYELYDHVYRLHCFQTKNVDRWFSHKNILILAIPVATISCCRNTWQSLQGGGSDLRWLQCREGHQAPRNGWKQTGRATWKCLSLYMGVSRKWGIPKSWMVFVRDNPNLEMDDDLGYPYFRKPPHGYVS